MALIELAILVTFYLTWTIGVQSMGTSIGISIGSGVLNLKNSVYIGGIFSTIGILFFAPRIIETVGKGLINFDLTGVIIVIGIAAVLATFFAYRGIPASITYLIIGGIAGYSLGTKIPFNSQLYFIVVGSLVVSPLLAIVFGYLIYKWIQIFHLKNIKGARERELYESMYYYPGIFGLIILSTVVGADSIGVVVSVLQGIQTSGVLIFIGIAGLLFGLITWSYKIAKTSGVQITDLSPSRGFAAILSSGLVSTGFLVFGIPVSITQTLIGAIVGVGLSRGKIEHKTINDILKFWIIAFPSAFILTYLIGIMI